MNDSELQAARKKRSKFVLPVLVFGVLVLALAALRPPHKAASPGPRVEQGRLAPTHHAAKKVR